jgi:hypothetical protein
VVTTRENLRNPRQFTDALDEVLRKEAATPEDVLVVYYSGHGVQLDGKAQLLSTGVSPTARVAEDLRENAESAEDFLAQMERAIPGTRVLIVEACRNDPLASGQGSGQAPKGGFAFQQDDVPNTFVMFANRPGATTPVRSDYGLMGPFTESLIYALENSDGEIVDVFSTAARKTVEISSDQEPVLYHSKDITRVVLKPEAQHVRDLRAKELLNSAEPAYRAHAWEEFEAAVARAKAFASEALLQERLTREIDFARDVRAAEAAEETARWADAAAGWHKAGELFGAREWVTMKAAVASLLADDLPAGVRELAALAARSDSELAAQAKAMMAELTKAFPELEQVASAVAQDATKLTGQSEFERIPEKQE